MIQRTVAHKRIQKDVATATHKGLSLSHGNRRRADPCHSSHEPLAYGAKGRPRDTRFYRGSRPVSVKCPEQADPEMGDLAAEGWVDRGKRGASADGKGFLLGGWNVLKLCRLHSPIDSQPPECAPG